MKKEKLKIKNARTATVVLLGILHFAFCIVNCSGQLTTTPFIRSILTNATAGQARTNLGAIGLPELTNANTLYVQTAGNNATAVKGNSGRPWASISNALAAVANNQTVLISAGDYNDHKGFVAHQVGNATFKLFNLTNVHIRGYGSGTRIGFTNYGTCFWLSNCNNVTISDMSILGLSPTATGINFVLTNIHAAIEVERSTNCTFERLFIKDHGDQGVMAYQQGGAAFKAYDCIVRDSVFINLGSWTAGGVRYDGAAVVPGDGWIVTRNYIDDCARGVEPFAIWGRYEFCSVTDNFIKNCMDQAVAFGGNAVSDSSYGYFAKGEISRNIIIQEPGHTRHGSNIVPSSAGSAAIYVHNASNITIRANDIYHPVYYGILADVTSGSNMTHIVIADNLVVGAGQNAIGVLGSFTGNNSVINSSVNNNYLYDTAYVPVQAWYVTNCTFNRNTINNWGLAQPGVQPAMDFQVASNLFIFGNDVLDTQGTHTGQDGIKIASTVKSVRLAGNNIRGQLGAAIVNNAAAELLYDDYAKMIGTTNLADNLLVSNNVALLGRTASAILRTDGSKNLGEVTIGANLSFDGTTLSATGVGGGTNVVPPISSVQYNSNGVLSGSSGLVFTNGFVGINTPAPLTRLAVNGNMALGSSVFTTYAFAPANGLIMSGSAGFGVLSPQAKVHAGDGGGVPAISGETLGVFSGTAAASVNAKIAIISGTSGDSVINFGDTDNEVQGQLSYDNLNNVLSTYTGGLLATVVNSQQELGVGVSPINRLDVEGAVAIGVAYSGTVTAPTNGLAVEGKVGLGTATPLSALHVVGATTLGGSLFLDITNATGDLIVATNYTVILADSTSSNLVMRLQSTAVVRDGYWCRIKNIGANSVLVTNASLLDRIDMGAMGETLSPMQSADYHKQGTNWWKF